MDGTRPESQAISADNRLPPDDPSEISELIEPLDHSRRLKIGLTVAASVIIGLVVAVVLVVVPFAGAPENVISGSAMLGFALGWGLLAILSVRWSDQPQWWALVPAGLMALMGVVFLLWSHIVTINVLGWLWPPALLALVTWMIVQARRQLHSRSGSLLLYPVIGALALVSLGGGYQTISETLDRGAYATSGQLVDVGGYKLYIACTGAGSPTVLLEAGLGEPSSDIAGWIAPSVAQNTRVCVYDRAGRGRSESAPGPQDGIAVATDLHTLLDRAHIAGPFVVVGHSTGGVYMRIFAARYPDQVSGMVLLDSQPNEAFTGLPDYPAFYSLFRRGSALFPSFARFGVARLASLNTGASLPPLSRTDERKTWSTTRHYRTLRDEFAELPTALKQAQALTTFGDKPLIVITAGKKAQQGWLPLQDKMATLSTNSLHRVMPDMEHTSLVEDQYGASLSSQAINDVVEAVRTGRPLSAIATTGYRSIPT